MKPALLLAAALLVAAQGAQAQGTAYRWVDDQGQVHYSDQPPPSSVRQTERRDFTPGQVDASLPYEVRVAAENFPVTLYVSEDCGNPCALARALLDRRGVPYTERDLRTPEDVAAYRTALGEPVEVPAMRMGRYPFKGYQESGWNRLLDDGGYPGSAP